MSIRILAVFLIMMIVPPIPIVSARNYSYYEFVLSAAMLLLGLKFRLFSLRGDRHAQSRKRLYYSDALFYLLAVFFPTFAIIFKRGLFKWEVFLVAFIYFYLQLYLPSLLFSVYTLSKYPRKPKGVKEEVKERERLERDLVEG